MAVKVGEMTNLFSRIPRGFIIEFNAKGVRNGFICKDNLGLVHADA